jgi:GT2 family glycosyltransferase
MSGAGVASGSSGGRAFPLLVVVLNYRTADLTIQCLDSLAAQERTLPGMRVAVVDNDSGDGSAEAIAGAIEVKGYGAWAKLVRSPRNGGFAYGNNRGIEAGFTWGRPGSVLLLNSDTVAHGEVLRQCVAAMDADPGVGAMSCRVLNADGTIQNVTRRFPSPLRIAAGAAGLPWKLPRLFGWANCEDPGWDRERTARDVDWIGGAFMLIRTEALERLGGLDEGFFFYGEDVEFCHRLRRAGHRVRYDPAGCITHLGGASSDPARLPESARSTHAWNGRYLVQRRCYGVAAAAMVRAIDAAQTRLRLWKLRVRGRTRDPRFALLRAALEQINSPERRASERSIGGPFTALQLDAPAPGATRDARPRAPAGATP